MQLMPPQVSPTGPQTPQSAELAQVLQQMKAQQANSTPIGGTANTVASALNTFGSQAAGQGGQGQWTGVDGQASGNWFDSPLGNQVGGLFGLGKTAQGNRLAQGVFDASQQMAPAGAGMTVPIG
jgi:hypothetical protein